MNSLVKKEKMKEKAESLKAGDYVKRTLIEGADPYAHRSTETFYEIIRLTEDAYLADFIEDPPVFGMENIVAIRAIGVIIEPRLSLGSFNYEVNHILENKVWEVSKIPYMNTALYKILNGNKYE